VVLALVPAERHTAVNNAFIRNRIEAGDILDFAADSLSQHRIVGRPVHLYASREIDLIAEAERLFNR